MLTAPEVKCIVIVLVIAFWAKVPDVVVLKDHEFAISSITYGNARACGVRLNDEAQLLS